MATTEATSRTDHRLGFTSQDEETRVDRLAVSGELPPWLTGALVRVTPALLEVGGRRLAHWFDGVAMLNRFGFRDGQVSYASRFLESTAYEDAKEGEWRHGGFATDPCRSIFKRVQQIFSPDITDNPNVNLARIGERYIAMTETPMPVEFDPETLDTIGHLRFDDGLKAHVTTAHPHHDMARDELVNYVARFSRVSEYVLYGMPAGSSTRRVIARMPVKEPAYMHAFGMSERYLILAEYPLRANPLKLAFAGRPFIENYVWDGDEPTRFQVFDRASGERRGTYETDAFFSFHHVNAFERGDELVVDLCAYEDSTVIDSLYLDEHGPRGDIPSTELRRYTLDLDGGSVRSEPLAEGSLELPRIDYGRRNARDYRYAYFTGVGDAWIDSLVKVDVRDGSRSEWREDGCYPGEPVFVREPGTQAEDAGVVLSVVLDTKAGRSFVLVLDAGSFEEVARAEAPHHIPFGFHGQFFR
ncbi:MAG TPA: carotenoid oxygenase family protein [Thermoleophilaceae bacterium]|nr:carotenoid oxygenase family protein [Thermoleophilaceae bacterium]